jgi:predicted HTH domain antitoxin
MTKMTQIVLNIDPGAFSALRLGPKAFSKELKTAAVVQWYAEQRITQSKACEILGIGRSRFLDELYHRNIPALQLTLDEIQQEIHGDL